MKKLLFSLFTMIVLCFLVSSLVVAEECCRTGADALANAYVRANPIYAYFFGRLETYVSDNREHFVDGGDSIRCAKALSEALMKGSIQNYDPDALRRKQELDARLGAIGITPGPPQATAAQQLFAMALQLDRLVYALPPAANGNFQPLRTPRNQLEQQQMFAAQLFEMLLQDPTVAAVFRDLEPMIREAANLEYQILINMANNLFRQ